MAQRKRVKDWRKLNLKIGGTPLSGKWIDERRKELESLVEPFVTSTRADITIEFRGKRRYLWADPQRIEWIERPPNEAMAQPLHAVLALQFLYRMEAARAAGKIDEAIRMAIAFTSADTETRSLWSWGIGGFEAAARIVQSKRIRRETRLGKTDLRGVGDTLLESIVANHRRTRKRNWLTSATEEINQKCGTSVEPVTVRREMVRRGIWDRSTKVGATQKT